MTTPIKPVVKSIYQNAEKLQNKPQGVLGFPQGFSFKVYKCLFIKNIFIIFTWFYKMTSPEKFFFCKPPTLTPG